MSGLWRWRERLCRLQVSADLVRAARVGVGLRGVVPELGDGVSERCELGDLLLDLGEARVEEVAHVLAGSSAAVADFEDLADLGEGEARGLAAVDEVDPGGRLGRVVAVSGRRALGRGQQALLLVEPQRLRRRSRPLGEFPDAHRRPPVLSAEALLTFPCTGRSSMAEIDRKSKY